MQFWTTLIEARAPIQRARDSLKANCTHVKGNYYIMEGDVDVLRDDGVALREIAEGAVGSLGGLTQAELIEVCREAYGVQL